MKRNSILLLLLSLAAQAAAAPAAPAAPEPPAAPAEAARPAKPQPELEKKKEKRAGREIVQFGRSVVIGADETVEAVVVIGGSAEVLGAVERDLVVVGGSADVQGAVGGDAVAVGGSLKLGPKARIEGDAVSVGGALEQDPGAFVDGDTKSVGIPWAMPKLDWLRAWVRSGLLMGRPLPPDAGWAWTLAAAMLAAYLLLAVTFPKAVELCSATLASRPATSLGVGALVLVMAGPLALLLVLSVIGLAAAPLAALAAGTAVFVGKAAVYHRAGSTLGSRLGAGTRAPLAVALGGAAFTLLYAVPGVGFVAWGAALVLGFGAALITLAEAFKGETAPVQAAGAATAALASEPAAQPKALPAPAGERASFGLRLGAIAVDVFAFLVLAAILPLITANLAAWALYQIGLWTWKGTTLGGIVCGIRGVRLDGSPMGFGVSVIRHLASYLSLAAGFLGFLWAAWDPEQQTWHDKIAGTVVVRLPKGQSLL